MFTKSLMTFSLFVCLNVLGPEHLCHAQSRPENPSPQQILAEMDKTIGGYTDQEMKVTMTITDSDGTKKSYDILVLQKGDDKRMVKFLSSELKGMTILSDGKGSNWVYLPAFKRVRRISSNDMKQTFAGSDFSNDDMAATSYSKLYDTKLEKEDEKFWWLTCTPKGGTDTAYSKLVIKVEKGTFYQSQIDYYDLKGVKVKEMKTWNPTKFEGGLERHQNVTMGDPRTGHITEMIVTSFRANIGLKDSQFTKRAMMWGR